MLIVLSFLTSKNGYPKRTRGFCGEYRAARAKGVPMKLLEDRIRRDGHIGAGNVPFALAIPCAVCNILGAILGSHFALSKGGKFIRPMLLVVLVLLLGKMAMDLLG